MTFIVPAPGDGGIWTYGQDPTGSTLDAVRWLCQDTNPDDPLILDSEVQFALSAEDNIYLAAALCCDVIAAHFGRLAQSQSNGDVSRSYGDRSSSFTARAETLRTRASRGGRAPMPYAGGLSQADMDSLGQDSDAIQPYFKSGIMDHRGESVSSGYGLDQGQ